MKGDRTELIQIAVPPYQPLDLALHVRNLIVLITGLLPESERETRQSFLAVICELERQFDFSVD